MEEFLRSANFACLPFGEQLAHATRGAPDLRCCARTPIGPLPTYPGDGTWTAPPYVEGVVLIGDAAGYNSPIIGQGLSIARRDARLVRDALRRGDLPAGMAAHATERTERMRRLRNAAMFMASLAAEGCDNRPARRAKFFELQLSEPLMMAMTGGMFAGPEHAPPEAFDGHLRDQLISA